MQQGYSSAPGTVSRWGPHSVPPIRAPDPDALVHPVCLIQDIQKVSGYHLGIT